MPSVKLTQRAIDRMTTPGYAWDTELLGLGLRVQASGRKTFVFRFRPEGGRGSRQRELRLGTYPALSVDAARREAQRKAGDIAGGRDPAAIRKERREADVAARLAPTIESAGVEFLKYVKRHHKARTVVEYGRQWQKHVLPALGTRQIAEVETKDLRSLHRRMADTPVLANRTVALLSTFFEWAEGEGLRARNSNPAVTGKKGIKLYPEQSRERYLSPTEYTRLGEALRTAEMSGLPPAPEKRRKPGDASKRKHVPKSLGPIPANPYAVAVIRFLALTGWREQEVLTLHRDAVRDHIATLADSKGARGRARATRRVLGAAARLVLDALPRLEESPYVFPGREEGEPLKEIARVWLAVRHAAKLDVASAEGAVVLHTLRHSFASVAASLGYSDAIIGALIGHKRAGVTAKYTHLWDESTKSAADATAGAVASYLGLPTEAQAKPKPAERAALSLVAS